jgi:hypothetical protein
MTLEYEINEAARERAEKMAKQLAVGIADTIVAERLEDDRFETAKNLIQAGVSIDVIAKSLGLSPEQVEQLKESL